MAVLKVTIDPLTHDVTTDTPLTCKVTYVVDDQGFSQEYEAISNKFHVRELSATNLPQYAIVGLVNLPVYTCTARGDVTSLTWTVEGRTDVNENGVSVTLEQDDLYEKVSKLTVTKALKDETFVCSVTYSLGGTETVESSLIALGKLINSCTQFILYKFEIF